MTAVLKNRSGVLSERVSPFRCHSFTEFFDALLGQLTSEYEKAFSFNWLAKQLGYRSHKSVCHVARGSRLPSADFLRRLGGWLDLNENEQLYLDLLVQSSQLKIRGKDDAQVRSQLERLNPKPVVRRQLTDWEISHIAHWWNLPIKNLVRGNEFCPDPKWISERLRGWVSPTQVQTALDRLVRLGILRKTDTAKGYEVVEENLTTTMDIAAPSIRQFHSEQLELGRKVLRHIAVEEREFLGLTLKCSPERTLEAKRFLRQLLEQFDQRFGDAKAKDVFQLNIQFFPTTKAR